MKQLTASEALGRMAAFCSAAEQCRADAREKLRRWKVDEADVERILDRLEQEKFIDGQRFCRAFINDKFRFAKWGKVKIAQALKQKEIAPEVYRPLLEEIDRHAYLDTLQKLLELKRRSVSAASRYEMEGKLARFALGRGYEMDDIRHCLSLSGEEDGCGEYEQGEWEE
ncbi:MAG: RecX family transcriptional regulator [Prevotellaceae bacterium]|nr:RecX family transcriptional regulator [Prevotellaceae bacterium]